MFGRNRDVSKDSVMEALKGVAYPGFSRDIVSFGMVKDVVISGDRVRVTLELATQDPAVSAQIEAVTREALGAVKGVASAEIVKQVKAPRKIGQGAATTAAPSRPNIIPGVKHKVAVASGKGGVGKSSVAVNLAVALGRLGHSVGLLDADIYGPSIPIMMGVEDARPSPAGENKIAAIEKYGIKMISIGFFLTKDSPLIWRGPMVMKAIEQFLKDVEWGELDYLVIDLPPGTGDAVLSLSQLIALTGAVIVTTPQDVALRDAVKGVQMFNKVNVPIIGIVENMSYFECPHCHERTTIFSTGGGEKESARQGVPFLGAVPIDVAIREGGDTGVPVAHGDGKLAEAFQLVARAVVASSVETPELKLVL